MADTENVPAAWESGVLRFWGQHGEERVGEELARLRELSGPAELSPGQQEIVQWVPALSICNWDLEAALIDLCRAIGTGVLPERTPSCMGRMTQERWLQVWAWYAALREWLAPRDANGWAPLLAVCDPEGAVRARVTELLGEPTELKQLYAERFALCLRWHLDDCPGVSENDPMALVAAHRAAVQSVEAAIRERNPDDDILVHAFRGEGDGTLNVCHHKAFRRYEIILSSIGAGGWRRAMPMIGTTGFERARTVGEHIDPMEAWTRGEAPQTEIGRQIHGLLGPRTPERVFIVSLLLSLMRAEQIAAEQRAQQRAEAGG